MTLENRKDKASEYYAKALEYYALAELRLREANQFDVSTNGYFNMRWTAYRLDDRVKPCAFYHKALEAYRENIRHDPEAKQYSPTGTVPELIQSGKAGWAVSKPYNPCGQGSPTGRWDAAR